VHKYKHTSVRAFTVHSKGLATELVTSIWISEYIPVPELKGERIKEVLQQHEYKGVWDTGATSTSISRKIVKELNLIPTGKTHFQAVGAAGEEETIHDAYTYLVNVYFPHRVILTGVTVSDAEPGGCDVLLGMDIIRLGDLAISNWNGQTAFSFRTPSVEKTDYVQEINAFNRKEKQSVRSSKTKRKPRSQGKQRVKKKKRR